MEDAVTDPEGKRTTLQAGDAIAFDRRTQNLEIVRHGQEADTTLRWRNGSDRKRPARFIANDADFISFAQILADAIGCDAQFQTTSPTTITCLFDARP